MIIMRVAGLTAVSETFIEDNHPCAYSVPGYDSENSGQMP